MSILLLDDFWKEDATSVEDKTSWIIKVLLAQVGVDIKDCHKLSVINEETNEWKVLGPKAEGFGPQVSTGKYVRKTFQPALERTKERIAKLSPNVIVGLGQIPSWFLLNTGGVKAVRGAVAASPYGKTIVTHSASDIIRDWKLRPIVMSDFAKARAESTSPTLVRPSRKIWIEPTLADLAEFEERYIRHADLLSTDIETNGDQITCIGFAPSPDVGIVIPLSCTSPARGNNYWPTLSEELVALSYIRRWCQLPALFQNGLYDVQFLWRRYGIAVPNMADDTMLLHHAMQPEMQKGLGFLGSIYSNEASWKFMRKAKHD